MPRFPFSPEILDALPEELAELFRGLELDVLKEICSRLKAADTLNEVTVQDIRVLRSHGIDLEDIKKTIAETSDVGMDKLNKLMDDVVKRNQAYYTDMVDIAKITAPPTLADQRDIDAIIAQAQREYGNITRSMGFLVDKGKTMLPPAEAYQHCLDMAELKVQSGAFSYNQAIQDAVRELADSGLKVIEYESGHVDSVDTAVRRAVMTATNQLSAKYREQSVDYLETDLVECTAHQGARDTGVGPANHKSWQGRWYRWSEKPRASKGNYPDFVKTTGYGTGEGLCGWNCRHNFHPVVEGVNEPTYTEEYLANIDPPPFEYDGKTYTAYEATQMQRQIEREIRKQKRRKTAFEASGLTEDATAANIKLRRLNQKYKEFSNAAGLPEQRDRMRVLYESKLSDIPKFSALEEYEGEIKVVDRFSPRQYVVKLKLPHISKARHHVFDNEELKQDRKGLNVETAQDIIDSSKLVLYQSDRETLKFLSEIGYAVINMKKEVVTIVPEKLRKKYRNYLEGK